MEEGLEGYYQMAQIHLALQPLPERIAALHTVVRQHPGSHLETDARQLLEGWFREGIAKKALPDVDHSLHSDHCSGHCQRHSELAIPGSPILRPVLQQQLDRRALFREYQLQTSSQKVQALSNHTEKRHSECSAARDCS